MVNKVWYWFFLRIELSIDKTKWFFSLNVGPEVGQSESVLWMCKKLRHLFIASYYIFSTLETMLIMTLAALIIYWQNANVFISLGTWKRNIERKNQANRSVTQTSHILCLWTQQWIRFNWTSSRLFFERKKTIDSLWVAFFDFRTDLIRTMSKKKQRKCNKISSANAFFDRFCLDSCLSTINFFVTFRSLLSRCWFADFSFEIYLFIFLLLFCFLPLIFPLCLPKWIHVDHKQTLEMVTCFERDKDKLSSAALVCVMVNNNDGRCSFKPRKQNRKFVVSNNRRNRTRKCISRCDHAKCIKLMNG